MSLTVTAVALTPRFFLEPWNVWVPVFAFALFLLLVWGLVCEHVALLPIAVAVGSHCVQTHISYTVLVGGLLAGAVAWLAWLWWRTDRLADRHPLRWLLIATATLVVAWLPPVIEQMHPGTGNLRKLYHQFSDPGAPFVGARAAIKALIGRFNLLGPWIIDAQKDPRSTPNYIGFVLFLALVGISARWAWGRRDRVELSLYAVLSAATVFGFFSTMRIFGVFFEYVIRWMLPLVALWIATCLWSCWLTWRARTPSVAKAAHLDGRAVAAAGIAAACAVVATGIGVVRAVGAEVPYQRDSAITAALSTQLDTALDPSIRYQLNEVDPAALGSVAFGMALQLEKQHHVHVGVGPWGVAGVTPFRVVDDQHADARLWYVASQPLIDAFSAIPGALVMAEFDVRSAEEAQRSDQLQAELLAALCSAGRPDLRNVLFSRWGHTLLTFMPDLSPEAAHLLQQYSDLRLPAAVIDLPLDVDGYLVTAQPPGTC
jgi:membrane associated rhomboid family serine protease